MSMPAPLRKVALTSHVVFSVGWLGAVAAFLALAVAGLAGSDAAAARGAYMAMDVVATWVIVPLAFASLASGVVQSLSSPWGLLRHWWVVVKLVITVVATAVLLLHMRPINALADAAAGGALDDTLRAMRVQLVANAAAALVALVVATALAVAKPRGLTAYGRRRRREERAAPRP